MNYSLFSRHIKCLCLCILLIQFFSFNSLATLKNPNVELSISGPTIACQGESVLLTLSGCNGNVNWQPSNFDGLTLEVNPLETTTYTAYCSDDPANPVNHTVNVVNISSSTLPQSTDPFKLCSNQGGATFYAVPNQNDCSTCSYQWIINGQSAGTGSSYSVTNIGTTTVALKVTNNGCSAVSLTNTVCIYGTTLTGSGINPTCNVSDGIINLGSLNSEGHYLLTYTKDGGSPVNINFNSTIGGTYSLSGLASGTYVLNVASSGGNSCPTNSVTVTLASTCCEKPELVATAFPNSVCYAQQVKLEVTAGCDGGTVSWDGQVAGSPIYVNPAINGIVYTARCTYSETCSTIKEVTVAVYNVVPKPGEDVTIKNVCPSLTVDISSLIIENTLLYSDAQHSGSPLSASEVTAIATDGVYYLFNTLKDCFSEPKVITVDIVSCENCKPSLIVKASPSSICIGETSQLEVVSGCENGTINWIGLTGNSPIVDPAIETIYSVRCDRVDPNCSTSAIVKVTVNPKPERLLDKVYTNTCPVDAINISDLITENRALYRNAQRSGAALTIEEVRLLRASGTYFQFEFLNGCYSEPATVTVNYTVCSDTCNISSPGTFSVAKPCINEEIQLGASCQSGTVIWYNSSDVEVSRNNPYTINSGTSPSIWYGRCVLGTCLSSRTEQDITPVLPLSAPTISSAVTFCGGGSTTLTTDCPARVRWWNETRVIATTDTYTTPFLEQTTTYYATCQNPNTDCYGAKGSVTITVNQIPSKPADVSRVNICPALNVNISDLITSTSLLYDNNIYSGNALTQAEVSNLTATKTYYLYNVQNNCVSDPATVKVTINTCIDCTPPFTVKATPNTICSGDAVVLEKVSGCDNGIVTWNGLTGETPTVYPTVETTYFVSCVRADPNCTTATSIMVSVNSKPTKPSDKTYVNTCPVDFINISELITTNTALYNNAQHSGIALNSVDVSNLRASGTYYLFATFNDCFSEPATITVNYTVCVDECKAIKPNVIYVGRPCKNNDQLMQINCSVGTPTLYATTIASNPLATFAVNSGTSPKTYYARCKVNEKCESDYAEIYIDPVDPQTPQIVANPAKICGTGGAVSLSVNCPAIVNWYNAAGEIIGHTNTYNTTITATTTFSVDCQTPASSCYNVKVNVTVPVIPIPAKPSNVEIQNPCPVLTVNLANILNGSNAIYDNNMHTGNPLTGEQLVISVSKKLYLFNVNEGCFSEPADINVTIKNPCNTCDITASTEPNSSSPIAICTGLGGVTFYASPNLIDCPTCTYQWLKNGIDVIGATESTYNISEIGTSLISVRIQKGTCTSTSSPNTVVIYGNTLTVTYIKPSCAANDGSITLASLISNGEYILSYSIDGVNQQELYFTASSNGTYSIQNLAAGTYVLTARWTGNAACSTNGITVYLNKTKAEEPIANGVTICNGQSTRLEATGCTGGILTWQGTSSSSIDVSPLITTDYTVTCTQGLCTNTKTVTVVVKPKPSTPIDINRSNLCPSTIVDLSDLITTTTALYTDIAHTTTALTKAQVAALTIGGTYYLFNIQDGCFSNAGIVNVTVKNCGCENPPILNASSSCIEKQGQIIATVSNSNLGTVQYKIDAGNWQSTNTFYPVTAGNHIIYAQFTNNTSCVTSFQVNVLDCNCNTSFDVTAVCDNAGTAKISTDDLVRLNINSIGGTGTWAMTASGGGSGLNGSIGIPLTNGYLGNLNTLGAGNTVNLTFTPNNNSNCAIQKTVVIPAACSPGCNLCFTAQNTKCVNGYLTFDLIVSGVGVNDKWSAIRKTTGTSGPTIASGTGPTISGGIPISIKLSDLQNQHGFVLWVMVDGVHDCLGDQYVFIPCNTTNGCNISGSFSDVVVNATTNTFTFKVSVVGSGSSNGWVGFYNGTTISGNYGQTVLAGPFPVAGGAVGFGIIDKDNPNCIINVGPVNSKCVGDECADLPNKPAFGSLPASICSGENVNITATCSNGGSPVWYSLSGNQILINTGTTDKTFIFRAACKVGNCISEPSETSIIVKPCVLCTSKPTNVSTLVSCVNSKGQVVVNATGLNLQYSLNNGPWQTSNTFTDLINGTYNISVRNSAFPAASCITSITAVVNCNTVCSFPTNVKVNTTCINNLGIITVTANGINLEYKLDNGIWQSSNVFSNVSQGSHTLFVKMQGCNETEVLVVKVACVCIPAVSTASISKSCNNGKGQIIITASGTSLLYSVDGGINFQSNNVFNNLTNKDYQIVIKSSTNQCLYYYPSLVNINCPPPCALPININLTTTCNNTLGTISITATGNNLEYKLDNGVWQFSTIFTNVALGSHTIYVRTFGCSEIATKTVNINCACIPTIKEATIAVKCINDKGEITISPLGNSILYSIDGGLTFKSGNVFSNLANGIYKIYIKTTSNSCLYIHPHEIVINCKSACGDVPCVQSKIIKTKKGK